MSTLNADKPVVIVGSGLAGYTLARELRKLDRDMPVTLISRDSGDYYSKPMLSNAFAQGKNASTLINTPADEMAGQLDITLLPDTEVLEIQREVKKLQTAAGEIEYGQLVLALGADPVRLPLQGDAVEAVLSVNDLGDYARLRTVLSSDRQVVILGGGLIGCEFANDLASAGYAVTVIDPTAYPISGLLPEQAGKQLLEPLSRMGVAWRFGVAVKTVDHLPTGYQLTLTDDSVVHADVVLSAVGLRPRIGLARAAGLAVNRGIVVDGQLRSSDESIYALGDCAEIEGRLLPYVLPIMHAARALAKVLTGENARAVFPHMPVVVKTPAHPVAVLPVARDAQGEWRMLAESRGIKLGFFDDRNRLRGFALTGDYAAERSEMTRQVVTV